MTKSISFLLAIAVVAPIALALATQAAKIIA